MELRGHLPLTRQVQCLNLAPSSESAWSRPQLLSLEMPWDSCPGPPRDGGPGEGLVRLTLSADGSEGGGGSAKGGSCLWSFYSCYQLTGLLVGGNGDN